MQQNYNSTGCYLSMESEEWIGDEIINNGIINKSINANTF